MGAIDARRVARPKWRAYLLLSRISNLPTVWTNVLAAVVASRAGTDPRTVAQLAASASLFYMGGMFLNDACDRRFDAIHRADRPIPAGDVTAAEAFAIGGALLLGGETSLAVAGFAHALPWGIGLAAAIVVYNVWHKGNPVGPILMGVCRGLVYAVGASAVAGSISPRVAAAGLAITSYVAVVTLVAKYAGRQVGWTIPWLIAGISLVDALVILWSGGPAALALPAAAGFVLTLAFQRAVPGT